MAASSEAALPPGGEELIPAKILVVDDVPRNLFAVEEMLRAPGLDIVRAESGPEALRHVLKDDFAVILLDVQMPGMDGYEVAELIRARPRSARVPIIFLTAFNKDDRHVARGYSAGAVDYVFKPIEPIVLKSKVGVLVDLYRKTEEIRRQAEHERGLLLENLRVRGEKLEAEKALRRREQHQALIVRALPMALYTASPAEDHHRLQFVSDDVERITGFTRERFLAEEDFWASRLHPDDRERVLAELARVPETGGATLEYRWRCADGAERHFLDQVTLLRDEDGSPREYSGMLLDNSVRRELEQSLAHASKLEAIGRLTGGIAHDFNNMLGVVIGNLDLLQRALADDDRASRRARQALDGATRCAELTKRLLAFSRRQPLQASVVDLAALVPEMLELLRRTLGPAVKVEFRCAEEPWPVFLDASQLEAALVNLAVNARDAMPGGGTLAITVENRPTATAALDGPHVAIGVADTGVGMSADVLERVFEPFFTTKEVGKGTGLGLSMLYGFVKQSDGHVEIESAPGAGTTVRLLLPRAAEEQAPAPAPPEEPEFEAGRGETILVVEDDPAVRRMAVSTLEELGYRVLEAEDGPCALGRLDGDEDVSLVFSDVRMPGGMTGIELAERLSRSRPGLPVLLTSGYTEAEPDEAVAPILPKPYRTGDLARHVRALLADPQSPDCAQTGLRRSA